MATPFAGNAKGLPVHQRTGSTGTGASFPVPQQAASAVTAAARRSGPTLSLQRHTVAGYAPTPSTLHTSHTRGRGTVAARSAGPSSSTLPPTLPADGSAPPPSPQAVLQAVVSARSLSRLQQVWGQYGGAMTASSLAAAVLQLAQLPTSGSGEEEERQVRVFVCRVGA